MVEYLLTALIVWRMKKGIFLGIGTVDVESFAGLNIHDFNPIEVFTEILLSFLGQKWLV